MPVHELISIITCVFVSGQCSRTTCQICEDSDARKHADIMTILKEIIKNQPKLEVMED